MPKTLVLFHGSTDTVAAMADAVAEGARAVRFAEVDVRRLTSAAEIAGGGRHRTLFGGGELAGYDGLVLCAAAGVDPDVAQIIGEAAGLRAGGTVTLSVGSAFVAGVDGAEGDDARWGMLREVARLGVVLVPADGDGAEGAKRLGHRIAHVVSWITHAKSHHH